jgi:AraC-like DNA-binding protein
MEYTRDLGYCATKYLMSGGHAAMISMQAGRFVPIPFNEMLDPQTGRTRVRLVDISSTRYAIARRYMIRLRRDDFEDPHTLAKLAATVRLSEPEFRRQFQHLVEAEPPPLSSTGGERPRTGRMIATAVTRRGHSGERRTGSIGRGKMIVEFFSAAISVSVCR